MHVAKYRSRSPKVEQRHSNARLWTDVDLVNRQLIGRDNVAMSAKGCGSSKLLATESEGSLFWVKNTEGLYDQQIDVYWKASYPDVDKSQGSEILTGFSTVLRQPLSATTSSTTDWHRLAIEWPERVHARGSYGSIFIVRIAFDPIKRCPSEARFCAVKQFASSDAWARETQALARLCRIDPKPAIVECYGTFQHTDYSGRLTHNLLLEYAPQSLVEYWSKTTPPT
ncbi:hypothetical protein EK21DRAFT_88644 [Setomelanomma holmii]|uniref:Uncharacterized protein n=1 Tax=Setomelanomma holmii TaxID=210430 RepID=A0A9P4H9U7_9PLEO|nr:hypothetical protein EK21DRAFT_88644 [Setomelanomma holmii]